MEDTKIGGPGGRFPATRWSAIVAARSTDSAERTRALETVVEAYWKPIYNTFAFAGTNQTKTPKT
jgi:hypothetical protein